MTEPSNWQPHVKLDLRLAKPKNMAETVAVFERWRKANLPPEPLNLSNGWYSITPQDAEAYLKRNPEGANRKLVFGTVVYYADQMQASDWQPTGQPIIFTRSINRV